MTEKFKEDSEILSAVGAANAKAELVVERPSNPNWPGDAAERSDLECQCANKYLKLPKPWQADKQPAAKRESRE